VSCTEISLPVSQSTKQGSGPPECRDFWRVYIEADDDHAPPPRDTWPAVLKDIKLKLERCLLKQCSVSARGEPGKGSLPSSFQHPLPELPRSTSSRGAACGIAVFAVLQSCRQLLSVLWTIADASAARGRRSRTVRMTVQITQARTTVP
jgi:hypothetical protein